MANWQLCNVYMEQDMKIITILNDWVTLIPKDNCCSQPRKWAKKYALYPRTAWEKCKHGDWMLWFAHHIGIHEDKIVNVLIDWANLLSLTSNKNNRKEYKASISHLKSQYINKSKTIFLHECFCDSMLVLLPRVNLNENAILYSIRDYMTFKGNAYILHVHSFVIDEIVQNMHHPYYDTIIKSSYIKKQISKLCAETVRKNISWDEISEAMILRMQRIKQQ